VLAGGPIAARVILRPGVSVAGVDGCRAGWVVARLRDRDGPRLVLEVVTSLHSVIEDVKAGRLTSVAVDMPIGLPAGGWRECDTEARRLLGRRRSSVFPTPTRSVLGARSYEEACARSVRACGKKVSKQLFNILPRIDEVNRLMSPTLQSARVRDVP